MRYDNKSECYMSENEEVKMNVIAILRLVMASMSVIGVLSVISSAIYRKTAFKPQVHPIFFLSIADGMVSILWISGSLVWLSDGRPASSMGCFTINILTIILQCVVMNLTLLYALLAHYSVKKSRLYIIHQGPMLVQSWSPLRTIISYLLAWSLPIILVIIPFITLVVKYRLVQKADKCYCWCLPFYGNVLPRLQLGTTHTSAQEEYKLVLHYFITSYSIILTAMFTVVMCSLVVIYVKVLIRIRQMVLLQGQPETQQLLGATQSQIMAGQKDAIFRVTLFLVIFFISGMITFAFGVASIVTEVQENQRNQGHSSHHHTGTTLRKYFIFLLLEAMFVPVQGFLNALVYGWTRGGFVEAVAPRPASQLDDTVLPAEEYSYRTQDSNGDGNRDGSVSPLSLSHCK